MKRIYIMVTVMALALTLALAGGSSMAQFEPTINSIIDGPFTPTGQALMDNATWNVTVTWTGTDGVQNTQEFNFDFATVWNGAPNKLLAFYAKQFLIDAKMIENGFITLEQVIGD